MSGHTSATGGTLSQLNATITDQALEDAITQAVAGITGLDNSLIRPRWQPLPPKQPAPMTNWVAVGVTERRPIDYPQITHSNGGPDTLTRWSQVTVQASVYGPNAQALAEQLRDGLYVPQNLEALATQGLKLTDIGSVTAVPDLFNVQWINRADIELHLAQVVNRTYNILDIASAAGTVATEHDAPVPVDPFSTELSDEWGGGPGGPSSWVVNE